MTNEIKEIFNKYGKEKYNDEYCLEFETYIIELQELKKIYDYITNLQEENQTLKNQLDFIEEQNHIIDKLEKENKILKENAIHNDKVVDKAKWNEMIYKSRNEKAIEYIKNKQELNKMFGTITLSKDSQKDLLNILGDDNE